MSKVIIFGAGGGADTAYRYLKLNKDFEIIGFTVDDTDKNPATYHGLPVLSFSTLEQNYSPSDYKMFLLMGFDNMSEFRIKKYNECKEKGYSFVNYIAPDIFQPEEINIGENCFILDKQTINLDVKIGNNVVMWSGNHIGDRTIIEDNVWISSHICVGGDTVIGEGSFLGMNATISHSVKVGKNNFIGAGSLITKSTKDESVYVLKPNRPVGVSSSDFVKMSGL